MSDFELEAKDAPARDAQRLLLVDDQQSVRDAGELLMTTLGFDVVLADNGQSAIEMFEDSSAGKRIDWAIIDVSMPGMSGVETAQRIREIRPALPIILATGYSDQAVPDEVIAHEHTALVRKPYGSEVVLQILENLK